MVFITRTLYFAKKIQKSQVLDKPTRSYLRKGFLDHLRINVRAGAGGSGFPRFGGKGGRGGHVFIQATEKMSLNAVASKLREKKLNAGTGSNSTAHGLLGKPGEDLTIRVPTGVMAYDNNGIIIGEVNEPESKLMIAEGGLGGCQETDYVGRKGQARTVHLDLKLISDIALVGFPNAGKSSLLRTVSRAAPKVAEYPFTTVKPNIATMEFRDMRKITMGDLPGLIEGAHKNIGMGYSFLKHIERSKMMLFVVDVQGFQLSPSHTRRNCLETIVLLNKEIELYKPDLLEMPAMLLINKMDTPGAEDTFKNILPKLKKLEEFVSECPEEIRPEKVVSFETILNSSLLKPSNSESEKLKNRIRETLDHCYEEIEYEKQGFDPVQKLIRKLKKGKTQVAPTLV